MMLAKILTAAVSMAVVPVMFVAVGPQDQEPEPAAPAVVATSPGQSGPSRTLWSRNALTTSFPGPTTVYGLAGPGSTDRKIQDAAKALRQAESSSERSEAKENLTKLLEEDYDSRLMEYEEYLDSLEKQLEEMRSKLRKRREAKDDMIDLRIKVLEAEADDLGWPSRVNSRSRSIFGVASPSSPARLNLPARSYRRTRAEASQSKEARGR